MNNVIVGKRIRRKQAQPVRLPGFIPIREPGSNKLLCRVDPETLSIEIVRRGYRTLIDIRTGQIIQAAPIKPVTLT